MGAENLAKAIEVFLQRHKMEPKLWAKDLVDALEEYRKLQTKCPVE